ncbi:hypothetical protein ATANTOWER_008727 [Ataeniobius toweri]|uniref:Uncharacterized protein n=1 Tax=Ataeniobius toweri TaxID=208326 RepID=A0ABU7B2X8_9TELE|nr:hypothetical protein [Ataeniobius toweri]
MPHTGRRKTCEVMKKIKMRLGGHQSRLKTHAFPTERIVWRPETKQPEVRSPCVISSVCAPQNPTGLTRPNARSAVTERLACLRGGGGGGGGGEKGTWMNGKKSPSSDWQAGRQGALTERNSSRLSAERGGERTSFSPPCF